MPKRLDGSLTTAAKPKIGPLDYPGRRCPEGHLEMIQKSTRIQRQEIAVGLKHHDLVSAGLQKERTTSFQ